MKTNLFFSHTHRWATGIALICLLLSLSASLVFAATQYWDQKTTASTPSARFRHAMAYIGDDQALLFGGDDGSSPPYLDDTWVYDLSANTWTDESPTTKPSARYGHAMAYLGDDQVLLFGGSGGSGWIAETWVYDLSDNTWTNMSPATSPTGRGSHAMAYLGGDQALLFGGYDSSSYLNDTWVYDLSDNTWTDKNPSGDKPSARCQHAMTYIGDNLVLLFGGYDDNYYDDTWVYDLSANTWTNKGPGTKPSARDRHGLAYVGGDQALFFGGEDAAYNRQNDTWVYDLSDNTWTQRSPTTSPSAREFPAMAYLGNEWVVLFGGFDAVDDETWIARGMGPTAVTLSSFRARDAVDLSGLRNLTGLAGIVALAGAGWIMWRKRARK